MLMGRVVCASHIVFSHQARGGSKGLGAQAGVPVGKLYIQSKHKLLYSCYGSCRTAGDARCAHITQCVWHVPGSGTVTYAVAFACCRLLTFFCQRHITAE